MLTVCMCGHELLKDLHCILALGSYQCCYGPGKAVWCPWVRRQASSSGRCEPDWAERVPSGPWKCLHLGRCQTAERQVMRCLSSGWQNRGACKMNTSREGFTRLLYRSSNVRFVNLLKTPAGILEMEFLLRRSCSRLAGRPEGISFSWFFSKYRYSSDGIFWNTCKGLLQRAQSVNLTQCQKTHENWLRRLLDLLVYLVNAVIRQVDPADFGGIGKRLLRDLCDKVVLQVQVVGPEWDARDHTDVPVLTVQGIGITGRA